MNTDRLAGLRQAMKEHQISAVILPTSDFHDTEYVCDYFASRRHFSGFTGSAGILVVLENQAGLWTDGRYFIQAAHELEGSGIDLMKMGMPGTPEIEQYICDHLQPGQKAAVDGRCMSVQALTKLKNELAAHDIALESDLDLAGEAWPDRPALPQTQTFHYDEKYTGRSVPEKLAMVREKMKEAGAKAHVTTKIDDIAWLYNLRAHDIPNFPVALAYTVITQDGGTLYIDQSRLDDTSRKILEEAGIELKDYNQIYEDIDSLEGPVLMDPALINSRLGFAVADPIWAPNPIQAMKAIKNEVEVEGARQAHLKDGVAVTKFWHWLENEMAQNHPVTEISAAARLGEFRAEQPDYIEDSFTTIAAYGPNAAMAHYHADEAHPVPLENHDLFLVDSGGHYLQGTTDITRTFVMGDLTEDERHDFTRVLQGHINLARAIFPYGARGMNLDILAREPLWKEGKDYNHGTGHGVAALSNVHEGPNGFRWKIVPERQDSAILEPGHITSDEPGMYVEGKYGIRHENLLVTVPAFETEYGKFLRHDVLTLVPFDVRGLDLSIMEPSEIEWLNQYHQQVREALTPYLNEEEAAWLKEKTEPVHLA